MNTEKGRQHLTDTSYMKEEEAGCNVLNTSTTEESSRELTGRETAVAVADTVSTEPANMMSSTDKPSLSYIALIAKVLLSSPSQKLNLASIYRAMEEQFPYLRSRGPGWRNSVRHNLSVNDCFVKVSRCEDGRGHYWGVHPAHLRDFQQGNFRQYRKTRSRRERERCDTAAGCLAWMETSCYLGRFCGSRCLGCVEPRCPLQEPRRYQMGSLHWAQPVQPWSVNTGWVQPPSWMRCFYFPDSYGREHDKRPMTSRRHCWEMNDTAVKGMKESYDNRFTTPAEQQLGFPDCWCMFPVVKELIKPVPFKFKF